MDLVLYFFRFRLLLYERQYILKFLLASRFETGRIMEDELGVALEGKLNVNIMDPSLAWRSTTRLDKYARITEFAPLRWG